MAPSLLLLLSLCVSCVSPAVHPNEPVQYNSTALLRHCHAAMQYNRTTQQYETPPLAIWFSADDLFYSQPTEGVATWLDVLVTAKHPW